MTERYGKPSETHGAAEEATPIILRIMAPDRFAARCREITETMKGHRAHRALDRLSNRVLASLGYGEGIEIFETAVHGWHGDNRPYPATDNNSLDANLAQPYKGASGPLDRRIAGESEMSRPTLIITDALTGLQTVHFEHGSPIVLGVPLCVYCDSPLTGDHCHDCDEHVDLAEAREYAEKLARFVYEAGME